MHGDLPILERHKKVLDNLIFSIAISTHFGLSGDFAHIHPHIQYQSDNYITGVYHNSDKRASAYVGKRTKYKELDIGIRNCTRI